MRGTRSIESEVTPRAASASISSGRSSGRRRDDDALGGQRLDLVAGRPGDAQHDIGARQCRAASGDELRAGEGIALVGEPRGVARAALEAHPQSALAERARPRRA